MATFEEFCLLLVVYYDANLISDEDFLLLNELFPSKNPNFPYEENSRFNLDNMSEAECKAAFRFNNDDLPVLADALQIRPPSFGHRPSYVTTVLPFFLRDLGKTRCDKIFVYMPCQSTTTYQARKTCIELRYTFWRCIYELIKSMAASKNSHL